MESTEKTPERRSSSDGADLELRNEQLDDHIDEAERAVDRRRSVTGETPAGDPDDLDDAAGGEDPQGAVDQP